MKNIFQRTKYDQPEDMERLKTKMKETGIDMEQVKLEVFSSKKENKEMRIPAAEGQMSRLEKAVEKLRVAKNRDREKGSALAKETEPLKETALAKETEPSKETAPERTGPSNESVSFKAPAFSTGIEPSMETTATSGLPPEPAFHIRMRDLFPLHPKDNPKKNRG
ncbi:MAG: hypothetical protein AB7V25_04965 [Mangrovibacterium sp.]